MMVTSVGIIEGQ